MYLTEKGAFKEQEEEAKNKKKFKLLAKEVC